MKVDVKTTFKDYDGTPLTEPNKDVPISFREIASNALNSFAPGENLLPEQKSKIFELTQKLYTGNSVDVTHEQIVLIKERVGIMYGPLLYGRICELLGD